MLPYRDALPLHRMPDARISLLHPQASFCHVPSSQVLTMHDVSNIWRVPLMMQAQGAHDTICRLLGLGGAAAIDTSQWKQKIADKWDSLKAGVCIAMVGKYTDLSDAYLSVTKALQHACMAANRKLKLEWVEASNLEETTRGDDAAAYEGRWRSLCCELHLRLRAAAMSSNPIICLLHGWYLHPAMCAYLPPPFLLVRSFRCMGKAAGGRRHPCAWWLWRARR